MENTRQEKLNNFYELFKELVKDENEQANIASPFSLPKIETKEKLEFTEKEIEKMPRKFRTEFRVEGCTARIYRKKFSNKAYGYEIFYRRNGYHVYASHTNLEIAKQKFIEKLKTAERVDKSNGIPNTFNNFAMYYFENFRKKKVKESTYQNDMLRYNKYLKPYFDEKPITKITSLECQNLIEQIANDGKGKTAEEIYSIMSIVFKGAIAHSILTKNPLDIIVRKKHEREHGSALTKDEEKILLEKTAGTEYQLMFAIALYTGLRPNEYETAKRDGDFIVAVNSKRKNGKVEYKRIPITPMLKPYIKDIQKFTFYKPYTLREKINAILPNHILYDLRTTFYSRCTECDVSDKAQKLFVGHSLGELGNAYTCVSDEFLLKEGEKLNY